jgi:uncharacterized repeat protein (TIGR02543 family)
MATAYSGEVDKWRARLDYAYSDTDDTLNISCNAGFESIGYGFNIASGVSTTLKAYTNTFTGSGGVYSATGATTYSIQASGGVAIAKTHETVEITLSSQTVNASGYKNGTGNCSATITMYPKSNYTVTYNANGGSGAPSTQTKWYNETLTLSTTKPTRTGYTFQGWATSSSGSVAYASGASYTANAFVTLYAVWKANTYTVTYNANGGTGAPSAQTKTYGVSLTLSSTVPTRNGYNFLGWGKTSTTTTVSYKAGASYTTNAAITLYAVWETAYIAPKITAASAYRSNSSGTATNDGTYFKASFTWSVDTTATSGNKASSLKIEYKTKSATSWTTALSTSSTSSSGTTTTTKGTISTSSAYDVRCTVTDTTGGTATTTVSVPKAVYLLDIDSGGAGIGILTTAPTSGLEIGAATSITGALTLGSPLTIANGGTGLTSSPSMLTNLASTSSASILTASPRPGVTGTLPIANGGTGSTSALSALNALCGGNVPMKVTRVPTGDITVKSGGSGNGSVKIYSYTSSGTYYPLGIVGVQTVAWGLNMVTYYIYNRGTTDPTIYYVWNSTVTETTSGVGFDVLFVHKNLIGG